MPQYKVNVKWGRNLHKDVVLDTDMEPNVFKAQLYALTNVPPERQKVMIKGSIVKDDDWGNAAITQGCTIMLMGTVEGSAASSSSNTSADGAKEDPTRPKEIEAPAPQKTPVGLNNLGNTCYLNATIQCLKVIPELRDSLDAVSRTVNQGSQITNYTQLSTGLQSLYRCMDDAQKVHLSAVSPTSLLDLWFALFPRFCEVTENGSYRQQDASEAWNEIVQTLQRTMSIKPSEKSLIDKYFRGTYDVQYKAIGVTQEPVSQSTEQFYQLSCFITKDVNYLMDGLKLGLTDTVEKKSSLSDTNLEFQKTLAISRLPVYLTVHLMRFYYKGEKKCNAKIKRPVKFSLNFDAYDLCSEELKKKLLPMREKIMAEEEKENQRQMEVRGKKVPGQPEEKRRLELPFSFEDDLGASNSGYYSLKAILTHKGRYSDSGHYVAWVQQEDGSWYKCDDDVVTQTIDQDVLKLDGSWVDGHCAYILLYGPRTWL
ncbi:ubiquitin carboxyl-terminal hydrolase [Nesidiocoris tenuis]|uniref:Ubiquitin carboxyl-terminal hydrolase n=1 Tax=Nesidiocoris tenuis TaxID=355587 RepID=A0ABN7ANH6_9HEMI|nr:ubiquitin carboxyl-terminal hydrolase [Nesidiocoris tenuis]